MIRYIRFATVVAIAAMLAVGCFTQQLTTTIKADGSGTHTVVVGISKAFLEKMAGQIPPEQADKLTSEAMAENAKKGLGETAKKFNPVVEPLKDDAYIGVKVTFSFKNLDEFMEVAELAKKSGNWLKPQEEGSEEGSEDGSNDSFEITRDGDNLTFQFGKDQEGETPEGSAEMLEAMKEQMKGLKMSWVITAPFITSVEGPKELVKRDGNTVTITFEITESTDLTKSSKVVVKASLKEAAATTNK